VLAGAVAVLASRPESAFSVRLERACSVVALLRCLAHHYPPFGLVSRLRVDFQAGRPEPVQRRLACSKREEQGSITQAEQQMLEPLFLEDLFEEVFVPGEERLNLTLLLRGFGLVEAYLVKNSDLQAKTMEAAALKMH